MLEYCEILSLKLKKMKGGVVIMNNDFVLVVLRLKVGGRG